MRRFFVTLVSDFSACLMAMYLSTFIMTKCDSDTLLNTLKAIVANRVLSQYVPEVFPCSSAIVIEMKKGWPITPIAKSVVDKQPSAMLVLVFNRCLVLTAIMTSAFKTVVSGQVMMLKTVMKISQP